MSAFQFTRKSDYGLLILTSLAKRGKGEIVSLGELSRERYLPKAFASQICKRLVKAKIIGSKEGRGGGYYLIGEPEKVSLLDVLSVIEGPIRPVRCQHKPGECKAEAVCLHRDFMIKLGQDIRQLLSNYSLADITK
jgi:Rrf2 family protein